MADSAQPTKKHKDADCSLAPLPPRPVKLRDTSQFSKSLVDWCRYHQEDNTRTPEQFPSCSNIKTHRRFSEFTASPHKHKRKDQIKRFKTDNRRNSGLSCFIGEAEQPKKDIEDTSQENKQKAQKQSNTAVSTATGGLLTNNGNGVKFKFKHFADPEDVVSEYINVHIYNKTRLGRVDKKKVSASVIELHNIKKGAATDFNEIAKPDKSLQALRTSETIIPSDKLLTDVLKLDDRLPRVKIVEKAMATKNFIYDLRALDTVTGQNGRRDLESALSVGPALLANRSNARLTEDQKALRFHRAPTTVSLLPKLESNELRSMLNVSKTEAKSLIGGKTVLPDIPGGKNLGRKKGESCRKPNSDIDVKVAKVKSNWQLLKQRRNCTQRMVCTSSQRTKRIFDTLEKMSTEIHKTKNPWMSREANNYENEILAIKSDENSGRTGNPLFPKTKTSEIKDTTSLKYTNNEIKLKKVPMNEVLKEKTLPMSKKRGNRGLKSEVEKYLDKYSLDLDKKMLTGNQEKEVLHPSSEVVTDMLAELNIFDVGFHIYKEKRQESITVVASPKKSEVSGKIRVSEAGNSPPSREVRVTTKAKSSDTPVSESLQNKKECGKIFTVNKISGANQTDEIDTRKNNAFVEMGLNGLEGRVSKGLCSQILKSDFLKKDLSFKPAHFFRTPLNFKNTPNSGSALILGSNNYRSDSLPCDKWLQKKIQRIITSTVGEGSKNGEEPLIIVEKLKKGENDLKKLHQIVDKRLDERKGKKKSFAQKFIEVQTDILLNPRLQAILPGLIDGIPNFAKRPTR